MLLPLQPIASFNRNRRREFWNVQARLVRKVEGEDVGVEVVDGCRHDLRTFQYKFVNDDK